MHTTSYDAMARFVANYLDPFRRQPLRIMDVGSQDVNGSYRPLFDDPAWRYAGADMVAGKNVDIVLRDVYSWREIKSASFDVVVSGQTLEHVEYPWMTVMEIARVLKPAGICCLIAPSAGPEHRYPLDCWRWYADGAQALARYADLDVVEAYTFHDETDSSGAANVWHDTVLVATKTPSSSGATSLVATARRVLSRLALPR